MNQYQKLRAAARRFARSRPFHLGWFDMLLVVAFVVALLAMLYSMIWR